MEIVNGTGKPKIEVTYNDASTATVNLPYCQNLQERFEEMHNLHTMLDKSTEIDRLGIHWGCTLSYQKLLKGMVLQSIGQSLFRSDISSIYITPRVDIPSRKYLVYWTNRVQASRAFTQGHAGVELQFEGMEAETGMVFLETATTWPVVDSDTVTVIDDYDDTAIAT